MKKNSQKKDTLKPEQVEAAYYVFCDYVEDSDNNKYFVGEVVGTYIVGGNFNNFLVRSNAEELASWNTSVGDLVIINCAYIVRKATELEIALC